MASPKVEAANARLKQMESEKQLWLDHFQLIGEFIMTRKQSFTTVHTPGEFLTRELFDNTAQYTNNQMASAILGAMWPNGARSIRINPPDGFSDTKEIRKYYAFVTKQLIKHMDNPKAGLMLALTEYFVDQGAFGTSGVGTFENDDKITPLYYKAWDVKTMHIDEGATGFVDTIYNVVEMTIRIAAKTYGLENLSATSQEAFGNSKKIDDKIVIVHAIEPRMKRNPNKFGSRDKPWGSLHYEKKTGKILKESGFDEMPVAVGRMMKATGEKYGRSPGMLALPDIIELNAIWESVMVASEKELDPPLAVLDDGRLGGGDIDTSAGAINVLNVSGRINTGNPIFPLFTVKEFKGALGLIEKLVQSITQAFFIDRLLDLNNEREMTAFETSVRDRIRGESLSSLFIRQEVELFTPVIERTFNILLKKDLLGVQRDTDAEKKIIDAGLTPTYIPDAVVKLMASGENAYDIQYISPAKRIMQSEEVKGIFTTFDFAVANAGIAADMIDNLDTDAAIKRLSMLTGMSEDMVNSLETVKALRKARSIALAKQQDLEQLKMGSEAFGNIAQAQAAKANAGGGSKKK